MSAGSGDGMRVRDASPGDRDAIRELTLAAYQEYAPPMADLWPRYRQNILDTLADVGPAEQLVAEQGDELVGTALLYPARRLETGAGPVDMRWPEVRLVAVTPEARGRGVGAALMTECARRARRAGASTLTLHTNEMMRAAVRLYRRLGYVRVPELDFSPAPGVTIEGYRLDLTSS